MSNIDQWVQRLDQFDYYACYSDDASVWRQSRTAEKTLQQDIAEANLSHAEKHEIIELLTVVNDQRYLKNKAAFSCIADQPLWASGSENFKKRAVLFYLGMEHK